MEELKKMLFDYLIETKDSLSPDAAELLDVSIEMDGLIQKKKEIEKKIIPMVEELAKIEDKLYALKARGDELEKIISDRW